MAKTWEALGHHWCYSDYRKTSNISHTLVANKIVDHSDVVGASPVQLHLSDQLNTWIQWIGQRQLQDETLSLGIMCVLC